MRAVAALAAVALLAAGCGSPTESSQDTAQSTSVAADQNSFKSYLEPFGQKIQAHWPASSLVWPGVDFTKHVAVVFKLDDEKKVEEAWSFDTQGSKKLSREDLKDLTPPDPGQYSEATFKDRTAIFLSVDDSTIKNDPDANDLYRFASHEPVHFYHQQDITLHDSGASRSQEYPINPEPRILRQMAYHNMVKAYENPKERETYLRYAKYWHDQWKQKFPNEYKSIAWVDIAEGHARYIENFLTFRTTKSTPEEIHAGALKNIKKDVTFNSADQESYEIGYVASLLLDENQPSWKDTYLKEDITQAEKLLSNITPLEEKVNPKIERDVTSTIEDQNKEISSDIAPVLDAEKDINIPLLQLDTTDTKGSFYSKNFINHKGKEVVIGFTGSYSVVDGEVALNDAAVFMENGQLEIPLPKDTESNDGILNVDTEKAKIKNIKVSKETDASGRTIYRAKATS